MAKEKQDKDNATTAALEARVEAHADKLVALGVPPAEARRIARRKIISKDNEQENDK